MSRGDGECYVRTYMVEIWVVFIEEPFCEKSKMDLKLFSSNIHEQTYGPRLFHFNLMRYFIGVAPMPTGPMPAVIPREQVDSEEAQWLSKQIGSRLPPGWGATWTERGCGELTGTRTDQQQLVVGYLRAMEVGCVECQVRYRGTCQQCQLKWCTLCQQNREECDVCGIPLMLTADREASGEKTSTQMTPN